MTTTRTCSILSAIIVACGVALSVGTLSSGAKDEPTDKAFRPIVAPVSLVGSYSAITAREYHRIMNAEDWRALWERHAGERLEKDSYSEPVLPVIDFERFMIVAIFNGEGWNTRSMAIEQQAETDSELHIRFDSMTYQTMDALETEPLIAPEGATPEDIARLSLERMVEQDRKRQAEKHNDPNFTRAYGLFVLPRSDKTLVLIENVQGLLGSPPIWEEQKRFTPVK